jgi:small-conductance mechanosensitive channel/CRP-like cAMP-binding protein
LLLLTLAQTVPAPAYDPRVWVTDVHPLRAALIFAGILVAGLILAFLLRHLLARLKLTWAFSLSFAMLALYLAAWGLKASLMTNPDDPIAHWLSRAVAAGLVFAALRFLDRLVIVPILTRGGKLKLSRFIHQIVNIVVALFAILIFGSLAFGWDIDRFLAGSAVVSIVLGLALQETLGNFFSGLVMQASPPFTIGDWIICGSHEGRVVDMTWRAVTLHTNDDNFILIPNATVAKAEIVNYHAPTTATARSITVGLDYDVPPCDALAVLKTAASETPGVIATPEPFVYLQDFTDAAVLYRVKFWIDNPSVHTKIEHAVRLNIWYRLHGRGFGIPFPTFNLEYISLREKKQNLAEAARGHRLSALDAVPLFAPLTREQKRQLADSADDYVLAPGQTLFRQNDAGDTFFIIHKGQVAVLVTPEGSSEERQVATLGPGDFFGEMSVLTGQPRTATIRALTPIALVRIEKQDLRAIFEADLSIMAKISEIVARRNAEREAVMQGAGAAPAAETVVKQQKSLLGRMMSFFRLAPAA